MATPTEFQELNHFAIAEVQKERSWTAKPGPQHADDPRRLFDIAMRIKMRGVNLSQAQADRLFEYFQTEAQEYRKDWHQYFPAPDAYKEFLAQIKDVFGHLVR